MSFDPSFQGTKNYIADRDGTKIGKWVTYADAAQTNPVDGIGGAPASTFAVSTDSTMRGVTNFLWTHSAANRQGEGFSYDFSIDPSDKGKVLQCSFEYLISSGVYADNDMSVWIYDVTNAVLIQPAPYLIKNSGIIEKFAVEFQTSSNSTSYRLIFHVDTATATAYTIRFTNFNLGPQAKLYGSAVTDWLAYTPTIVGFGTPSSVLFDYRRVGDTIQVRGRFTSGTNTAVLASISFPGGLTSTASGIFISSEGQSTSATNTRFNVASVSGSTGFSLYDNTTGVAQLNGSSFSNSSILIFEADAKIQGWSSSQVFSQDADTRVVALTATTLSSTAITNVNAGTTKLAYSTVVSDTHGGYNSSTGDYTVKVPGKYKITAQDYVSFASGAQIHAIYKNSSALFYGQYQFGSTGGIQAVSGTADLVAGDVISIRSFQQSGSGTATWGNSNVSDILLIERISGPSQIAASESVSAMYTGAPPTGTLNGSLNNVTFGTKVKDSHNGMSGATYTVPTSGTYSINAAVAVIGTRVLGSTDQVNILVNGSTVASNIQNAGGAIGTQYPLATLLSYPMLAGQTVTVQVATSSTTPSYDSVASRAYFSITRTGQY